MSNQEFSPRESLERAFRRWWVIVLLTVLGGMVGWAIHFFQPPVYQATAVITVDMNFEGGKLSQYEEDYYFNAAGAVGTSTGVIDQVVTEARKRGLSTDFNQLQQEISFEREQSVWLLHVRDRDPQTASELANIWVQKYLETLTAALPHAIRADAIQAQIDSINNSLSISGPSAYTPEVKATLQNLSNELLQEQQASQGISSNMKFALTESATVPRKPVLFYLADMVLAGACIGFVISLWLANIDKVKRNG